MHTKFKAILLSGLLVSVLGISESFAASADNKFDPCEAALRDEPLSSSARLVAKIVNIKSGANEQAGNERRVLRFISMTDRLLCDIDFDIVSFSEAQQKIDDDHDAAMRYNSGANMLVSGMSGILPPALQYPGSTVSVRSTNNIGIIGSALAVVSSAIAMTKASEIYHAPESTLLAALVQESVTSKIYPYPVECFLDKCLMHHLNYVGLKIVKLERYHASKQHKDAIWNMNSSALAWLKDHWKHQYEKTVKDVASDNDAVAIAEAGEFKTFKSMSADGISDRIAMLQELRVLVECARSSAFELYSKSDKFADANPTLEESQDVQGKRVEEP